jgi:hypothetical protein
MDVKTSRVDPAFVEHVTKFIAVAKRHRLSLKKEVTICPCKSCKNLYAHGDDTVKSHLVRHGFIKDYTIWKFHGEAEDLSVGASGGGNSSTAMMVAVNAGQQTSSAAAGEHDNAGTGDNTDCDYITMEDLLQDTTDDNDGDDGSEPVRDLETAELFESIANSLGDDDILFGNPRWLENFREMKQAAIVPLYKDCPKHWIALRFNLQMLMLKAHHGWSNTSFNDLLRILANTYPEGNKVLANTYQAKKLIWPVAMKLKKFHAYCNHYILYRGERSLFGFGN